MSTHYQTFRNSINYDKSMTDRLGDIQIIDDCRNGRGFKHFYYKCLSSKNTITNEETWRKMYSSMNDMDTVIKKFISFCPNLDVFIPAQATKRGNRVRAENQQKLMKKALKTIKWKVGINEVYDTLESKGDCFFYVYFNDENDKIPKLKYLDPSKMTDVLLDQNSQPSAYIYKDIVAKQEIDSIGNIITNYTRPITLIFEKGRTLIIDPVYAQDSITSGWKPLLNEDGTPQYGTKELKNRPSYIDEIAIVRFQSYKKFNEKFSRIPASSYIDHCLSLDIENSNIEIINKMLGFPVTYIIGGEIIDGERMPSGFIYVDKIEEASNPTAPLPQVVIGQITNGLESIFKQIRRREDSLYDACGLVNKTAQEKLGNTDSARVVATYEAPKKNKIELYVDNILEGMELYTKIVLKENNLYDEEIDYGITLFKPKHLSQGSIFDEQLYDQNAIGLGSKTKEELALQNGDSYEDIKNREEAITIETQDISKETNATVRSNNN